jgi:hypothetical protein
MVGFSGLAVHRNGSVSRIMVAGKSLFANDVPIHSALARNLHDV